MTIHLQFADQDALLEALNDAHTNAEGDMGGMAIYLAREAVDGAVLVPRDHSKSTLIGDIARAAHAIPPATKAARMALEAMEMKQRVTLWENDGDAAKFNAALAALRSLVGQAPSKEES